MELPNQIRNWWSNLQNRSTSVPVSVQCDEDGIVQILQNRDPVRLFWNDVSAVYAYKKDIGFMDQIRLIIGNSESGIWIEVTENDAGYTELMSALSRHISGCPSEKEWFQCVAQPPFEASWTRIYKP